ncbi:hypothetical protein BD413DRAFT_634826 [Trametes elegans]|nr:hypothetical protein BD413DRAFT_634826 [Trametes elegans]
MSSQPIVSAPATSEAGIEESLTLPDGRTLAYSRSGPLDSDLIVIWFHGLFSVGDATNPPPPVKQRNAHFIMPTLPGWGNTSALLPGTTYAETVVGDTLALLQHLRPTYDATQLRIFVAGGSLGTVPAQIVFGAPYARFPYGRQLAGMLLLAPFSPFREHVGYAKGLRWREWISVGPPTRVVPGNVVPRLMKLAIAGKVRDVPSAEAFLHHEYFEKMDEEEWGRYAAWRERRGVEEGFFQRQMAEGMVRSVSRSWDGFLGAADAIHSDWGFKIGELDDEHSSNPVVIGIGRGDTSLWGMAKFLSESYRSVRLREYEGGHLASAWSMDDLLEDMFAAGGLYEVK